jgi:hypothetical protein
MPFGRHNSPVSLIGEKTSDMDHLAAYAEPHNGRICHCLNSQFTP